jgi:hypothetical protein
MQGPLYSFQHLIRYQSSRACAALTLQIIYLCGLFFSALNAAAMPASAAVVVNAAAKPDGCY